jgi:hypothetical protein
MAREILHKRAAEAIRHLHPGVSFVSGEIILQDDGAGPFIARWGLPGSQPTAQDIINALTVIDTAPAKTKRDRLIALLAAHGLTIDDLKLELGR